MTAIRHAVPKLVAFILPVVKKSLTVTCVRLGDTNTDKIRDQGFQIGDFHREGNR